MLVPGAPPAAAARRVPLPGFAVGSLGSVLRSARVADFSPEQVALPDLRPRRRHHPDARRCSASSRAYTTAEAFADFAALAHARPVAAPSGCSARLRRRLPVGRRAPPADGRPPWVTPRSSRSAPAAGPAAAPATTSRRRPRAASPPAPRAPSPRQEPAPRDGRRRRRRRRPAPQPDEPTPPTRRGARRRRRAATPRRRRAGHHHATARPLARHPRRRLAGGVPARRQARCSATSGSPSWPGSWPSCAAGSPATTSSTSTASTPEVTERFFMAALRPIAREVVPDRGPRRREHPRRGRRPGRLQPLRHRPGRRPDDDGRRSTTTPAATCARSAPTWSSRCRSSATLARKGGATLACNEDAERMLRGGELVGVWPEGFKGIGKPYSERYKLQRFGRGGFVSAALRTGVPIVPLSVVGAEEIYPLVGNMPVAGPAARRALHPDHAVLPAARPARPGAAAVEVAARVRRADPHRRATTPAPPTTRCWSSTSPTRCARRSSRRSTRC